MLCVCLCTLCNILKLQFKLLFKQHFDIFICEHTIRFIRHKNQANVEESKISCLSNSKLIIFVVSVEDMPNARHCNMLYAAPSYTTISSNLKSDDNCVTWNPFLYHESSHIQQNETENDIHIHVISYLLVYIECVCVCSILLLLQELFSEQFLLFFYIVVVVDSFCRVRKWYIFIENTKFVIHCTVLHSIFTTQTKWKKIEEILVFFCILVWYVQFIVTLAWSLFNSI